MKGKAVINAAPDSGAMLAKTSTAAIFGGSGTAVMSAAATTEWFGFTPGEWQIIGILGGIFVGVLGLVINAIFKWLHYNLAKARGVPEVE